MKTLPLSITLAAVGLLATILPAWASVGETPLECARRYGAPVPSISKALPGATIKPTEYLSNGFRISVCFAKGHAASHRYAKLGGELLTAGEMRALMAENGDGTPWSEPLVAELTDGSAATAYRCGKRIVATYYFDKATGLYCFFFVRATVDLPY